MFWFFSVFGRMLTRVRMGFGDFGWCWASKVLARLLVSLGGYFQGLRGLARFSIAEVSQIGIVIVITGECFHDGAKG